MIKIDFSQSDVDEMEHQRLHHPHPRVQQKMWTMWMKTHDLPHHVICQLAGISENTLRTYMREYIEGGVESLKKVSFHKPTSVLDDHRETIEEYFRENPPMSAAQAIEEIQRLTGIKRGLTQTRAFMHRLGLDFRKVGSVPAKVDPEVQEEFKKKSWNPGLRRLETTSESSIS